MGENLFLVVFLIAIAVLYMAPWLVAIDRNHKDRVAIAVVNFFLGWTLVGWVVALAWAVKAGCKRPEKVLICFLVLGSLSLLKPAGSLIAGSQTFTAVLTYLTHHNRGGWDTVFGDQVLTFKVTPGSSEVTVTFPKNIFSPNAPPWYDNEPLPPWFPKVALVIPPGNAINGECDHPDLLGHRDGPCVGGFTPTIKGDLLEIQIPHKWFFEVANHFYVRALRWRACIETGGTKDIAFPIDAEQGLYQPCPPPSTGGGIVMGPDAVDPPLIGIKFTITWDYYRGGAVDFIMMDDDPLARYLACEVTTRKGYPELCPDEEHYGELTRLREWAREVRGDWPVEEEPECLCPN